MNIDDMIMVSIDDHVVEPPDMFARHVPAKWADQAPRVVIGDNGVDQWVYRGRPTGVERPQRRRVVAPEEWGRDPAGFDEMRPGVYDVHERVRDMSRNGILASMCFPTFTGFSAGASQPIQGRDHRRDDPGVQRLAHRRVGRRLSRPVHPAGDHPHLGPGARGGRDPPGGGKGRPGDHACPSYRTWRVCPATTTSTHWGPVFKALSDTGLVMCCHIGQGFGAIKSPPTHRSTT